jgi:RNA polymerase-binding transcription factor DksA
MRQNNKRIRRVILSRLYDHLLEQYFVPWPREPFVAGTVTEHEVEAVLAFKSDVRLDELRTALDRLDHGIYGVCISCKGRIPLESLVLNPAQRVCVVCEEHLASADMQAMHRGALL